jgi:hypothetical protein
MRTSRRNTCHSARTALITPEVLVAVAIYFLIGIPPCLISEIRATTLEGHVKVANLKSTSKCIANTAGQGNAYEEVTIQSAWLRRHLQLVTDVLSSQEALFIGKAILAANLSLIIYCAFSKYLRGLFRSNTVIGGILSFLLSLYAFQLPFSTSIGLDSSFSIWYLVGVLNLIFLVFSVSLSKYITSLDLGLSWLKRKKTEVAALIIVPLILVNFLTFIIQLFSSFIGGFYSALFNIAWFVDLGLTLKGAINGVRGGFLEKILRKTVEDVLGKSALSSAIFVVSIITSIIVVPQLIPFSGLVIKLLSTAGYLSAMKLRPD